MIGKKIWIPIAIALIGTLIWSTRPKGTPRYVADNNMFVVQLNDYLAKHKVLPDALIMDDAQQNWTYSLRKVLNEFVYYPEGMTSSIEGKAVKLIAMRKIENSSRAYVGFGIIVNTNSVERWYWDSNTGQLIWSDFIKSARAKERVK